MAASSALPSGENRRSPRRERLGNTHKGVPEGSLHLKKEVSNPYCRPWCAKGTSQEDSYGPDRTSRPLAAIRAGGICLHDSTTCGSIDHHLWWRHPRQQSAPRGRNSTGQADPAPWHDCERTSMPWQHPSVLSRHGYPDYGYPISVWLIWSKTLSRIFSEPPLLQEIIQLLFNIC